MKRKRERSTYEEGGREGGKEGRRERERESKNERREMPRESEGDWKERNGRDAADIA